MKRARSDLENINAFTGTRMSISAQRQEELGMKYLWEYLRGQKAAGRVGFCNDDGLRRCIAEGAGQDVFDDNLTGGFVEYLLSKTSLKSFSAVSQYFQGARAVLRRDFFGCDIDTMCSDASKKKINGRIQKVIVDRKITMGCKLTNPAESISREEYARLAKAMLTMNTPESLDLYICLVIARHLCCRMGDVGAISLSHIVMDPMMCTVARPKALAKGFPPQKLATMCDRDVLLDAAVAMGVKFLVHGGSVQTLVQGKVNAASHVTGQLKKVGVMAPEFGDHLDGLPPVPADNRKSHLSRKSAVADMDAAGVSEAAQNQRGNWSEPEKRVQQHSQMRWPRGFCFVTRRARNRCPQFQVRMARRAPPRVPDHPGLGSFCAS